jgi:hypothetical protein
MLAPGAIKYRPAHRNHSPSILSSCLPVHRKGKTLLLVTQALPVRIIRE